MVNFGTLIIFVILGQKTAGQTTIKYSNNNCTGTCYFGNVTNTYHNYASECGTSKKNPQHASNNTMAFSVGSKIAFNPTTTSKVIYEYIYYNDDGLFNTTTYTLKVPVTGLYSIYFGASSNNGQHAYVTLKNQNTGEALARAYDYRGHANAGARVLVKLTKDHEVFVEMNQSGGNFGIDRPLVSFFNGYLVKAL